MDEFSVEFSLRERRLILRHGFPLGSLEAALKASEKKRGVLPIRMSRHDCEHVLGFLAGEINHAANRRLQLQLNDLYEYLEHEAGCRSTRA